MAGEMSALEKEMAELLGGTEAVLEGAKTAKKDAAKTRPASFRQLEATSIGYVHAACKTK